METAKHSPLRLALGEFCIMFVVTVGWNLVRKSGEGVLDAFGVSAITAILIYFFTRQSLPR
jgi:hypothetical protein